MTQMYSNMGTNFLRDCGIAVVLGKRVLEGLAE